LKARLEGVCPRCLYSRGRAYPRPAMVPGLFHAGSERRRCHGDARAFQKIRERLKSLRGVHAIYPTRERLHVGADSVPLAQHRG